MSIVEDIRERVSMLDVLRLYGQYPVRGKNNYRCFVHDDHKPSAGITKDGKFYHCFACGYSGNIFDVVMNFEQCDFKKSMRILDDRFNMGLYGQLTHKEKLQLAREQKERERLKAEKEEMARFENAILNKIIKELRFWEECERLSHITRGEYRRGQWKYCDMYFYSLERQRWLNWIYSALCRIEHEECEYDYIYSADKKEILKMIREGEIEV